MDELIDDLIDSFSYYADSKKELKESVDGCEHDAGYFCAQRSQEVDLAKEALKENIIKIIKKVNENG